MSCLLIAALTVVVSLYAPVSPTQIAIVSDRGVTRSAQENDSLEPGKPIERELSGGQSHSYKIAMVSGQYLQIAIEQRGIDVAVALFTPDGKKIVDLDNDRTIEGS